MSFKKIVSLVALSSALHGCGKIDSSGGVEGIVTENGVKVFQIITSNGHPLCVQGSERYEANTDTISQHPQNDELYEATEKLQGINPQIKVINPKDTVSITTSEPNKDYFIVKVNGEEVLKLFTKEGRQFKAEKLSPDGLEKGLMDCSR